MTTPTSTLVEPVETGPTTVDPHELRRTIARVPAPVTLVATYTESGPVGFTASSFVNISVEPPLVGVFVGQTSRSYDTFRAAEVVAINLLSDEQSDVAGVFASKVDDKFAHVELDAGYPSAPVIDDAMGAIVGRVVQTPVLGDHVMLVLHVEQVVRRVHAPLVYQDRRFRGLVDVV
ncbi:MAG: flavin reductase family protein [Nocardioides sp.]|uniref:flavin reductase family protein n=1 Tax=Nocardioides sp. TaxID=35761 RepID=UPI003F00271B